MSILYYYGGYGGLDIWQIAIIGITFILAIYSQSKVKGTYEKYKQIPANTQLTGAQIARQILDAHNINDVQVVAGQGAELSDFYDPKKKIVSLSSNIYNTNSIAAVSVAAHEVGHAIQHATDYHFIALRNRLLPMTIVASRFSMIIIMASLMFYSTSFGPTMFWIGIAMYGIVGLFQLVTLPVEFDASKRALNNLQSMNLVAEEDIVGSKKMLNAAAFTYVAAFLSTILTILRLVLMVLGNSGRRRN